MSDTDIITSGDAFDADLAAELRGHADTITPNPDPVPGVRHRAHRIRRRRRIGAAVAGAAVVVAAPLGVSALLDWDGTTEENGDQVAEMVTLSATEFDALPDGPPPQVPWYLGGTIRMGDLEVPFDPGRGWYVVDLIGLDDGFLVSTFHLSDDSEPEAAESESDGSIQPDSILTYVPVDGNPRELAADAHALAVSPDGGTVGWVEVRGGMYRPSAIVTADIASGRELSRTPFEGRLRGSRYTHVVGFLDDGTLLLGRDAAAGGGIGQLDPRTGELTRLSSQVDRTGLAVREITHDGELAAVIPVPLPEAERPLCGGVLRTDDRSMLWTDCGYHPTTFDPDGRYVAGGGSPSADFVDWPDDIALEIRDARTGAGMLRIPDGYGGSIAWEPDGTVVFDLLAEDPLARTEPEAEHRLIRCSVDAECEVAAVATVAEGESFVLGRRHFRPS